MKKLIFLVTAGAIFIVFLLLAAFYFVDLSGHKSATYDCFRAGKPFGSVTVNRFTTVDKIIYKSRSDMPYALSYRFTSEKLLLKKGLLTPLRYTKEETEGRGGGRLTVLVQDFDKTDYLCLEFPAYFTVKALETGEKTLLFDPYDITTYMSLMERYNYWKMGTQFFEVMVPVASVVPFMRDKIEIRELGDKIISVMGRKVEAEIFLLRSSGLPEAKIAMAKYTHHLLTLEIKKSNTSFILTGYAEDPAKRMGDYFNKAVVVAKEYAMISRPNPSKAQAQTGEEPKSPEVILKKALSPPEIEGEKEVFFEVGSGIISGREWIPKGAGPFPAVLFIPKDGPVTNGEQMLLSAYGNALAEAGYIMLVFDNPGQGKSQGDILDLNGTTQLTNIEAALAMLRSEPLVKKDSIALIGHKDGGYLALEAARIGKGVRCCAVLELPTESEKAETFQKNYRDKIQNALNENGLGTFDNSYMENAAYNLGKHVSGVLASTDEFMYFLGTKLPAAAYRQYLGRKLYRSVLNANKPVLLVFGKNDPDLSLQAIEALKRSAAQSDLRIKIAVFNSLDPYLGRLLEQDNAWVFTPDHDVMNSILEWLGENVAMTASGTSQIAASATASGTK